jgi:hypothetical protein
MPERLRATLEVLAFIVAVVLIWLAIPLPAEAHTIDCSKRSGIDLARCERHQKMAAKCGPIQGDAHFACDREFLLGNPLDCKTFSGDAAQRCEAEVAAFRSCEPKPGREFMRCVRDATRGGPMEAR